jgi:hypothetical protein
LYSQRVFFLFIKNERIKDVSIPAQKLTDPSNMLKADLSRGASAKEGCNYKINCPELGIELESQQPERDLCREILKQKPELAHRGLKTFWGDKPSMIFSNIQKAAKANLVECPSRGFFLKPR